MTKITLYLCTQDEEMARSVIQFDDDELVMDVYSDDPIPYLFDEDGQAIQVQVRRADFRKKWRLFTYADGCIRKYHTSGEPA